MNDEQALDATTFHMRRALDGDMQSLGWIVERITPLMLVKARSYLRHPALSGIDPKDVVQEAWLVTLPKLDRIETNSAGRVTPVVVRFLGVVVQRICLGAIKARRLHYDSSSVDRALVDGGSSVVARIVQAEAIGQVLAGLNALPDEDRRIFMLRAVDGLEFREIITCLNIEATADHVRHRYNTVLAQLQHSFPEWIASEFD